jgi:hypothetical protein
VAKFAARGFGHDEALGACLREDWQEAGVDPIYFKSLMIFRAAH